MSVEGLEPSTNGLKGHCSAIELHALYNADAFYHAQPLPSTARSVQYLNSSMA